MPVAHWSLVNGRPAIQVQLTLSQRGGKTTRTLLADTGAGSIAAPFELLLDEADCILCDGTHTQMVGLGGAFTGLHPLYVMHIELPLLQFAHDLHVVGIATPPVGFDGIACFPFLNRFTDGNFGNPGEFALQV
jgi:hypothetical protein